MKRFVLVLLAACAAPKTPSTTPMKEEPKKEPDIVQIGKPVLRSRATDVPKEKLGTKEMDDLVAKMIATMRAAPGVGLAAPQIGVPWRVFVLEDRPELMAKLTDVERRERERVAFGPRVFVNPVITPIGEERAIFFEGCLSVRGYVGLVDRAAEVEVTGTDEKGTPQTWRVRGWPARILQHELDHLNGTLYIDRMHSRSFGTAAQVKERFGGKPIAEVLSIFGL